MKCWCHRVSKDASGCWRNRRMRHRAMCKGAMRREFSLCSHNGVIMSKKILAVVLVLIPFCLSAQDASKGKLATAKSLKCTFSTMAVGNWAGDQAKGEMKPAKLVLQFQDINTD